MEKGRVKCWWRKDVCAYREQYSATRQQNIANNFSLLWGKTISWHCVGDILREKRNGGMKRMEMRKG
jgi:hypothetical protein